MLAGVKDPARCVRDAFAGLASVTNLYRGKLRGSAQVIDMPTVRANEWYGVRVKGRGEFLRMRSYFKDQKGWRWDLGHCAGSFGPADAEGWREGVNLVCIPAGATRYTIHLDGGEAKLPVGRDLAARLPVRLDFVCRLTPDAVRQFPREPRPGRSESDRIGQPLRNKPMRRIVRPRRRSDSTPAGHRQPRKANPAIHLRI